MAQKKRIIIQILFFLAIVIILTHVFISYPVYRYPRKHDNRFKIALIADWEYVSCLTGIELYRSMNLCLNQNYPEKVNIEVIPVYHSSDITNIQELIKKNGYGIIVSAMNSTFNSYLAPEILDGKKLFITLLDPVRHGEMQVRMLPSYITETKNIAGYLNQFFAGKKLAIVSDKDNPLYSSIILNNLTNRLTISFTVMEYSFEQGSAKELADYISRNRPDIIYFIADGYMYLEIVRVVKKIKTLTPASFLFSPGLKSLFYSGVDIDFPDTVVPILEAWDPELENFQQFYDEFKRSYGIYPQTVHSITAYQAAELLIHSLNKGLNRPKDIYRYLMSDEIKKGLWGEINITAEGCLAQEYSLLMMSRSEKRIKGKYEN